jgi:hypothetical protein
MKKIFLSFVFVALFMPGAATAQMEIYGAWHCGNDLCTWSQVRNMSDFSAKNSWILSGNAGKPSINLVVLSFVHPLRLLQRTTDAQTLEGVPRGMTADVVKFFKDKGIRVMLSIGGITYTSAWNQALAANPAQLGLNAAYVAGVLDVGIDIDYEENSNPNLVGLQQFINAYRSVHPYDASGNNDAARLTIDLAAGDRWLIALTQKATKDWLNTSNPVLDYANAMVPARQVKSASDAIAHWQEHIDGKPQYAPPILPLAPAKFTGSLYLVGRTVIPECNNFSKSLQKSTGTYVQTVAPNVQLSGHSKGMLGFMFWAAECSGTRAVCTTPPGNTCEGGLAVGMGTFQVPVPMPPLPQL